MNNIGRYRAAAHAMQSGVSEDIARDQFTGESLSATTPKHLRVGINSALVDSAALARLLIAKGLITEDEYSEALALTMEEEKGRYEKHLTERLGVKITLA